MLPQIGGLVEGLDIPGVLIGMIFLRRFCCQFVHNQTLQKDYLGLQGIILPRKLGKRQRNIYRGKVLRVAYFNSHMF